jgi:hypothetical protein
LAGSERCKGQGDHATGVACLGAIAEVRHGEIAGIVAAEDHGRNMQGCIAGLRHADVDRAVGRALDNGGGS